MNTYSDYMSSEVSAYIAVAPRFIKPDFAQHWNANLADQLCMLCSLTVSYAFFLDRVHTATSGSRCVVKWLHNK